MPGPIPKPEAQRRRRNAGWIDRVQAPAKPAAPGQPPRTGKGSGRTQWIAYAESIGLELPANVTRAAIFLLVDERASLPVADLDNEWHPLARNWYLSLAESAQSQFYEPSDWQTARVLAHLLSKALRAGKITAALIERWQIGSTELLTTEGARRRVRLELERPPAEGGEEGDGSVTYLDAFRGGLG